MSEPPYWPPPPDWRPDPSADRHERPGWPRWQPQVQTAPRSIPVTLVALTGAVGAMVVAWNLLRGYYGTGPGRDSTFWAIVVLWGVSVALSIGTAFWLTFRASRRGTVARLLAGAAVGLCAGVAWGLFGAIVGLTVNYYHHW
jgi:hypothetical protein